MRPTACDNNFTHFLVLAILSYFNLSDLLFTGLILQSSVWQPLLDITYYSSCQNAYQSSVPP